MKTDNHKKVGVWLDHACAHFIDISQGPSVMETLYSEKESQQRFEGEKGSGTQLGNNRSSNNEAHIHNRQQVIMNEYYQALESVLKGYDHILLFGPTKAKEELYNRLSKDKHFEGKEIKVQAADNLTENQMVAVVRDYFK